MNSALFSLLRFLIVGCLGFSLVLAFPAHAKNEKHSKGYEKHHMKGEDSSKHKSSGHSDGGASVNVIIDHDRSTLLNYLESRHHCPPGLAKKNNGCLPPGQAKKYMRGMVVEPGIQWIPLPHDVVVRLTPPPPGALYVQVDQNVLLVTEATRKVLDAVTLLSAVK